MKNLRLIFYLILQACCILVYPQKQRVQFDHIGIADGLSQSDVQCVIRDSRGFMWFGTPNGLNKYDGYTFTVYKNDPLDKNSISNNYIMNIIESRNGDLWIATLGGGICRFDRNKEQFIRYTHDAKNTNSISYDVVHSIIEDEQGELWIGTEGGLDVLDIGKNKFKHFASNVNDTNSLGDSYVRCVFEDTKHNIWVGTLNGGINLYNRKKEGFTRFKNDAKNNWSIGSNNVYTIFEDSKNRLWLGTDGAGLELFNQQTSSFIHFKNDVNNINSLAANSVHAINEDAENNLWVGTENGGLSILNHSTGSFSNYKNDEIDNKSISNNSIYSIYKDLKNNMWLGTFAGGVNLVNRDKTRFAHFKHTMQKSSLSNNQVLCIIEDSKKNIWVGTDGGGLNLFDPQNGNFAHFLHDKQNTRSICGNYVLSVCEDSKGNIWAGTWGDGITMFNREQNTFKHFKNNPANSSSLHSNNAWKIFEDKDKNIWVCTFGGGLEMLNPDHQSFTHFNYDVNNKEGLSNMYVVFMYEDSEGLLWVCTDGGGLNLFDKKKRIFSHFMHDDLKNSISNNTVNSIWEDGNKNLWICTRRGLNRFDKKTKHFTVYTMKDGLPDNEIFGILEDDKKNLWISTNKGISCFNPVTGVFKNFDVSDGLQSNEFKEQAWCKTSSGMMYFGGNNGFNQFFPDSITTSFFDPPLVITNFQVFNKKVPITIGKEVTSPLLQSITETKTITLPYSNNVFSFEFATLNYTATAKKQYAYMLQGFDKEWNEVGSTRVASYTNLDPGTYFFKVKGLNNDGKWSSKITTIQLVINPPFWLTWWFKLMVLVGVVAGLLLIYALRVKSIKAQREKLREQVKEQTLQLLQSSEEEQNARRDAENARHETELANKELKLKNKELEQFAYVASHDLQEPLRTTAGFVELLQKQYRGKLDERADKYLNFISDASKRMKVLIKELLDFSRIGTKGVSEKVDCNAILKNVVADIMAATDEAGAVIESTPLPVISGYPTELKLLFQNLLINAVKFRKAGTQPVIKISAEKQNDHWEFAVSDNGIGIEKQYSERIFDIFQRLHTQSEYEGSGIGLSHCKKIVELHHGKIRVESTPGQGSTFYFSLPIDQHRTEKK